MQTKRRPRRRVAPVPVPLTPVAPAPSAADTDRTAKRCPYCLRGHMRRGRACSEWCERKLRSRRAVLTRSRNAACAKIMQHIHKRERHRADWRDVAMGRAGTERLEAIFGVHLDLE